MNKTTLTISSILLCLPSLGNAGEVTATFNDGEILTQEKLDNVKSAVNDNNDRIIQLEAGPATEVAIDCDADANALSNTTIKSNTDYILTGICNGPIDVNGRMNVLFAGDATGTKDDGISLPQSSDEDHWVDQTLARASCSPIIVCKQAFSSQILLHACRICFNPGCYAYKVHSQFLL